jgi:peptidoglycan/xylan/chitin deacetylase (PgdA/CDA1 family)
MRINSLSNLCTLLPGKISRLALKIFSVINFHLNLLLHAGNSTKGSSTTCNCVIFRLDDIPYDLATYDETRIDIDLAVMGVFHKKNQSLTLGLVLRYLELHPKLLEFILQGYRRGTFELALHGWDHEDYSKLSQVDQERYLLRAKTKFDQLFGNSSTIFIPPYNMFNRFTINAMKKLRIKIISSSVYSDYHLFFMVNQTKKVSQDNHICHLPEMVSFETFEGTKPIRIPLAQIVSDVEHCLSKYGYAIITLHPQSFAKFTGTKSDDLSLKESTIDIDQINRLNSLIEKLLDSNIRITSFSKLVGSE